MGLFRGVELADLTLTGERLELRRWAEADSERVFRAMQDPGMAAFLALPEPYDRAQASAFVTGTGTRGRDDGSALGCAVVERAGRRVVGSAELYLGGDSSIGYWIAADARGKGYAAEAVRLLAGWAARQGVPRVAVHCDVRNLASARTAMRAGFRYEGIARNAHQGGGQGSIQARYGDDAVFARSADSPGDPVAPTFPGLPRGALGDGVISVRRARAGDAQGYLETEDELTRKWSFDGASRSPEDAARVMTEAGLLWLVGREARCTVLDVGTGRYAGELQLRLEGPPGVGGIGYVVHPEFRGRGYTARALRLLLPWAFDVAGLMRLELGAKRDNVASQRAARSAGFEPDGVRVGRLRNADGTFSDEVQFVLLNPRRRVSPV